MNKNKKKDLDRFYIQNDLSRHRIATASGTDKRMTLVRRLSIYNASLSFFVNSAVMSLSWWILLQESKFRKQRNLRGITMDDDKEGVIFEKLNNK
jgi:hypothetical protein